MGGVCRPTREVLVSLELPDDMAYSDLPDEVRRVITEDEMREILAAFDPDEPITFIHDRNY